MEQNYDEPIYHAISCDEALKQLNTSKVGLTTPQAKTTLTAFGPNQLSEAKPTNIIMLFFRQFSEIMMIILLVAVVISGILGEFADALIILVILILNATLSTYQQYRAQKALEALKSLATPKANVKRDNIVLTIPIQQIVPGDIVMLEQGDIVPADVRLLTVNGLQIDESTLTGESIAVSKQTDSIQAKNLALGDSTNIAFKSSVVVLGKASGVVFATGKKTEIGRIASLLAQENEAQTPLQVRLAVFSRYLVLLILCVCTVVLVAGLLQGQPVTIMVLTALSLAVAAVPEALPAVITISLALGEIGRASVGKECW